MKVAEQISDYIHVSICDTATWAISGTSGINLSMAINQLTMMLMLRKLGLGEFMDVDSKYTIYFRK